MIRAAPEWGGAQVGLQLKSSWIWYPLFKHLHSKTFESTVEAILTQMPTRNPIAVTSIDPQPVSLEKKKTHLQYLKPQNLNVQTEIT